MSRRLIMPVVFIVAFVVVGFFHQQAAAWGFRILGNRDEAGAWYGFWSGFGGAIPDVLLITGFATWYYHHSCHDRPTCLRWGHYEAAGGLFKVCYKHHPKFGGQRPDSQMIADLHQEHEDRAVALLTEIRDLLKEHA